MIKKLKRRLPKIMPSKLKVFDIPLELLEGDPLNPNEMPEGKFDELCESMRNEGFDEPMQVIPHPRKKGYYLIAGGHWRSSAAKKIGLKVAPCVIKESWSEDEQKFALVKRNILGGKMNTQKFTALYEDLAKRYDPALLKKMLGFTEKKEFESLYEGVAKSLPSKQRKELAKAKEKIKSVDDLSSILNTIFKEAGSEADEGYMVFSFGGKDHHYVKIDDDTNKRLKARKADLGANGMRDWLKSIIADSTPAPTRKVKRKPK